MRHAIIDASQLELEEKVVSHQVRSSSRCSRQKVHDKTT